MVPLSPGRAAIWLALFIAAGAVLWSASGPYADAAADTRAPSSKITDPVKGAVIPAALWAYSIKGTSKDSRGGSGVAYVEVSTNGGLSWMRAADRSADGSWSAWSCRWPLDFSGVYTLKSKATDKAGNSENPGRGVKVTVTR